MKLSYVILLMLGFYLIVVLLGALVYMDIQRISYLDALYLCVMTSTTINTNKSPSAAGKLFDMFFAITGTSLYLAIIIIVVDYWIPNRHA